MKKIVTTFLLLLTISAIGGCSSGKNNQSTASTSDAAPAAQTTDTKPLQVTETSPDSLYYGQLQVEGSRLVDSEGATVQLKGISSHGINWFPEYINQDMLTQLHDEWGLNVFRVAMYTADYNGYATGDADNRQQLKSLIDDAVQQTKELGMYVIIDWHILSDSSPLDYQSEAIDFFTDMAQKYGDMEHVMFEICNEPNNGTTWETIKEYAEAVIPAIRTYSDNIIIVGTPEWSQDVDVAAQAPVTSSQNIMYALHFYAASHKEELRKKMTTAIEAGLPVFVTEFGISDASGSGAIDTIEADTWLDVLDEYKISYLMWNLSNKDESSSIIKPDITKTSGLTSTDLTPAGQWFYQRFVTKQEPAATNESTAESSSSANALSVIQDSTWESNGEHYYKYRIVFENALPTTISDWQLHLVFNQAYQLSDSWNGEFSTTNTDLTITPVSHNAGVAAGEAIRDIGFIVQSAEGLTVSNTDYTAN